MNDATASSASSSDGAGRAALIHHETVQLVGLVLVAVAAFFVTRAVAGNNRDLSARNAEEWYRRGERLVGEGRAAEAADAFRRATVRNRANRTYQLALSRALARDGDYDAARGVLLKVRESAPESAEINLDLARLSVARQDVTEALRFFHDALYAPWPPGQQERRRAVRIELIRFLLARGQTDRARSELLASRADMPDDVAHHVELASLFANAADSRAALTEFQRALRLAPGSPAALAGAGAAAFDVGDYLLARRYLRQAPGDGAVQRIREIAEQVVSRDPTAARIGAPERRRRLQANLAYVQRRLAECVAPQGGDGPAVERRTLQNDLQAFQRRLRSSAALDQDTIESGVDLIERVERDAIASCGTPTPVDRALLLIARRHGSELR